MKNLHLAALAGVGAMLSLGLAGCGGETAPSPAAPTEAPAPVAAQPTSLGGTNRWQLTGEGSTTGQGAAGAASIGGKSYLAVIVEKAPVAAGDDIVVKGKLTAPTGRPVRLVMMRHCDQVNGEDLATSDVVGTGAPADFEISHTFAASYGCIRLSVVPGDKAPVDVELSDLEFIKKPKP